MKYACKRKIRCAVVLDVYELPGFIRSRFCLEKTESETRMPHSRTPDARHPAAWIARILPAWGMAGTAMAACGDPASTAGGINFNTTTKTVQYCNGNNWGNTGPVMPTTPQTGCTSPTGPAGAIHYASPTGVVQFCNGSNWVNTACAAKRQPNGQGCDSQPAGTIRYNSTYNELQFCDSTNWVAMGWPCPTDLTDPVWNGPTTYSYEVMQGTPFMLTPSVTDDKPGITFSRSGTLPLGLTFNSTTGAITGTPTTVGTFTFTIRATDTSANFVERTFTVDITPAEVVVHIAANTNNVNIQSLFNGTDWADSAKAKKVIVDTGVTVGSTSTANAALLTGTGRGSTLTIINSGTIAGGGGAANGGAGGPAINGQQSGVTILNAGNIYGGGGGGGQGGTGGQGGSGTYNSVTVQGPSYARSGNLYYWMANYDSAGRLISLYWAGSNIYNVPNASDAVVTSQARTIGSYTYRRGTRRQGNGSSGTSYWEITREYPSVASSTGGAGGVGGNGGLGEGANQARTNGEGGDAGAAGGTNAGTGGTGGTGGNGGTWGVAGTAGATGNTGGAGNAGSGTAGLTGNAGGAAGAAITGSGYTLTNTGNVLGTY